MRPSTVLPMPRSTYHLVLDAARARPEAVATQWMPASSRDALLRHPAVHAAAAVGRSDRHSGEVPVAYVVPADPDRFDEAELRAWAGTAIGSHRDGRLVVTVAGADAHRVHEAVAGFAVSVTTVP